MLKDRESQPASILRTYRRELIAGLFFITINLIVYFDVIHCQFISLDDKSYVYDNPQVKAGLTWAGIKWAFSTTFMGHWHPLTWLSLMLDQQLFGLKPGGYHLVNLIIHIINTILLFWILRYATGAVWPSALVGALFAIHPLHVETVAWVADRKDLLSAMFGFSTILAYFYYAKDTSSWRRYALVLTLLLLGLMCKSILMSWPLLLLLLDF